MLEQIAFSQDDTLFVFGDVVDRGPEPIKMLQDMASRDNVYLLKGNHEAMASFVLHKLNVEITEADAESHINTELMQAIMEWQQNGGNITMRKFRELSADDKLDLLDYIDDAPLFDIVDVGTKTFILLLNIPSEIVLSDRADGACRPQKWCSAAVCMVHSYGFR